MLNSYSKDARAQDLLTKLSLDPNAVPHFTLQDGLLCYKSRIWVGADHQLQHKLVTTMHSTAMGGHLGVSITYRCLN